MKDRMKLPLAVALALSGSSAFALGLGPIQVKSGLNQPLVAEIAVSGNADETAGLNVALASAADFERVGLSRSRVTVPLEFSVVPGKSGAVIRVTTRDAVRDPFVDFLLEVNWAKGRLLREYTLLLDPPVLAPAVKGSSAKVMPVKEGTGAAATQPLDASKTSKPPRAESATAAPAAAAPKAARAAQAGEYGPVNAGEALWDIASATRPDSGVSLDQMMLALLRANPGAFYQDNINSLKRGAILRVPSSDEIKAAASAAAAAAEVKAQNDAWRSGNAAAKPTVVATAAPAAGTKPAAGEPAAGRPGDKLALVPPKAGSGSQAVGDKSATGGGSGDATLKTELARTKEALASREQEAGELKSRVKELEELKTKNDRLLSLKDSELAELQKKLKELQDKAGKPAPAGTTTSAPPTAASVPAVSAPAATTATATATPATTPKPGEAGGLTKEDIWGSAAATGTATKPGTPASSPSATTTTAAAPGSAASSSGTAAAPTTTTTPTSTGSGAAASAEPPAAAATATPAGSAAATATPSGTETAPAAPQTPPPSAATAPKPSSTATAAKPAVPAKVQPLPAPAAEPWYKQTWLLAVAGAGLLGVVVLALLNAMRRPKTKPVGSAAPAAPLATAEDEEHDLLDRLAMHPDDTAAHLELVSLYYARQEADKFEAAAQAMYAHLGDTHSAEWEQVRAMGRELAPHNPLFDEPTHEGAAAVEPSGGYDPFAEVPTMVTASATEPAATEEKPFNFELRLPDDAAAAPPAVHLEDVTVSMPTMDFGTELHVEPIEVRAPAARTAPEPEIEDDSVFAGEDAIGTKLDLAKAYLDMGDPEGARSMLEEVMGEGNAAQKAEAQKLLKELR